MGSPSSPSFLHGVRTGVERVGQGVGALLSHAASGADPGGWLAVTAMVDRDAVLAGGGLPAPLAGFADRIEVDVRPAPADKGTVIAARVATATGSQPPDDAAQLQTHLRQALRHTKQLLETGQIMRVDPQPAGRRTRTLVGKAIDVAQAHGRDQGVL